MTAHLDALVRELADAVKGDADDLPVRLRKGVVFAQSPLTVKIGGSAVAVPVQATGPIPANGTIVWVVESGPRRVLLDTSRTPVLLADQVQRIASRPAADLPSTYPTGFSVMAPGSAAGWPTGFPVVHTTKFGVDVVQQVYGVVDDRVFTRYANSGGDVWFAFRSVRDADTLDGLDSTAFLRSTAKAADSDLLDGLDSSAFPRRGRVAAGIVGGESTVDLTPRNLNAHLTTGVYNGDNMTGAPSADWYLVQVLTHSNPGNGTLYQRQVAHKMTGQGGVPRMYVRSVEGGDPTVATSWTAWREVSLL